ncbi:helix-turn-helix domain-containing protein, partial [Mycolicibacterium chlorophenolicum]|uniref:helix-turn-helix domain-containing protein n=2 Tax=Mycolicibacterium chlorophenolicum TaxID=37916 RepID=UPI000B01B416
MVHANAVLTPRGRLLLARLIVDEGWPIVRAAEHFHVSWPTAKRWATRYVEMGPAGMADRSSRPDRCPHRTPLPLVRKIVELRWRHLLSPLAIASRLSMPASTVHAVLVRCRLNRLSHIDIRTGEPIRRYEYGQPGAMIHVDVKKLGNIPAGGGWRFVGRAQGGANRRLTPGKARNKYHHELIGHAFVHTVIDDHSRVAYAEIHDDETAATA